MSLNASVAHVTERIVERSAPLRRPYLDRMAQARDEGPSRAHLSCGNQAHAYAAMSDADKAVLVRETAGNLGIVTAYNDMLSAHQPFETYPALIRQAAREVGGTAQVAGGVPAMCDGVTQGQAGMELSLFSRDVIAMAAGIALSAQRLRFDRLSRGLRQDRAGARHRRGDLRAPAGGVPAGRADDERHPERRRRPRCASSSPPARSGATELMEAEMASYHGPGTCTFYGTANTNQMLMEFMGLHLPGASFVNPGTPLREALTIEGAKRALAISALGNEYTPVCDVLDERAFVNGIVGLNATGGSTNLLDPPDRDGAGGRDHARLGGLRRALGRDAADGAGLSERARRREPFPRRGRPRLHDRRAARGRAAASRHPHGRRATASRAIPASRS